MHIIKANSTICANCESKDDVKEVRAGVMTPLCGNCRKELGKLLLAEPIAKSCTPDCRHGCPFWEMPCSLGIMLK